MLGVPHGRLSAHYTATRWPGHRLTHCLHSVLCGDVLSANWASREAFQQAPDLTDCPAALSVSMALIGTVMGCLNGSRLCCKCRRARHKCGAWRLV